VTQSVIHSVHRCRWYSGDRKTRNDCLSRKSEMKKEREREKMNVLEKRSERNIRERKTETDRERESRE